MSEITASIAKDGAVLAESVSVELTVEGSSASRWYGNFKVGPKVPLSLDATCLLTFADGRRGEAQVTRIAYAGPRDPVRVHFRGKSALA